MTDEEHAEATLLLEEQESARLEAVRGRADWLRRKSAITFEGEFSSGLLYGLAQTGQIRTAWSDEKRLLRESGLVKPFDEDVATLDPRIWADMAAAYPYPIPSSRLLELIGAD